MERVGYILKKEFIVFIEGIGRMFMYGNKLMIFFKFWG